MKLFAIKMLTLSLVASTVTVQAAEPRWYEVHVLIFSQKAVSEKNPETWPTYPLIEEPDKVIKLNQTDQTGLPEENLDSETMLTSEIEKELLESEPLNKANLPEAFKTLPNDKQLLTDYAKRLKRDYRYKILFNDSWNHPILPKDEAIPVEILGGEDFGNIKQLSGLLNIHVSRYLHVETDLYLTEVMASDTPLSLLTGDDSLTPDKDEKLLGDLEEFGGLELFTSEDDNQLSPVEEGSKNYYVAVEAAHMKMKRRMRSKELHYFDNPQFGMLIYFEPIEIKKAAE